MLSMSGIPRFPNSCTHDPEAVAFYEWLLCLDQDVSCIWNAAGGINAGSLVYTLGRFSTIMNLVLIAASTFPLTLSVRNRFLSPQTSLAYASPEVIQSLVAYLPHSTEDTHASLSHSCRVVNIISGCSSILSGFSVSSTYFKLHNLTLYS